MDINQFIDSSWIPILAFALCLGFGIKILITKDPTVIKKELATKVLKDSDKYCRNCGILVLALGIASLASAFISLISPVLSLIVILSFFAVVFYLWKKNDNANGPL